MVDRKKIIITALIIIAGLSASCSLSGGNEKKVKKLFARLEEKAEKKGEESIMKVALRVRGIGALFAEESLIESNLYDLTGTYSPDDINSLAAAISVRFTNLSIKFYDIRVSFPAKGQARANLTAMLTGASKRDGPIKETRELEVDLVKIEGEWYFRRISMVEVLEK